MSISNQPQTTNHHSDREAAAAPAPAVVPPDAATVIHAFGDEIIIHLGGSETDGVQTLFTSITPPGGGPPPHYHTREDEWFMPLAGRIDFFIDGVWQEIPIGTLVYAPKGVVHTFKNIGDEPSRLLTHVTPSGMESFFAECAEIFARPGAPDMEQIAAISARCGIYFVNP